MDQSSVRKNQAVALHEVRGGETLGGFLHLRVRKSDPDFRDFIGKKEVWKHLNIDAQEGRILQAEGFGLFGSGPHTCTLDVDSQEILPGITCGQSDRIFSVSAAQFEHDGMVVAKHLVPMSCQCVLAVTQFAVVLLLQLLRTALEDMVEGLHLCKFLQLILSHYYCFSTVKPTSVIPLSLSSRMP